MSLSLPSADQGRGSSHASFFTQSTSNGDMINAVFGVFAVLASAITIWQGHKTWKMWREHHPHRHAQATVPLDVELGGPPPPYTSPELAVNRPLPGDEDLPAVNANSEGSTLRPVTGGSEAAPVNLASNSIPVERAVPSVDMQLGRSPPSPSASASPEPFNASPLPMNPDSHTEGSPHPG